MKGNRMNTPKNKHDFSCEKSPTSPSHYKAEKMECKDAIQATLGDAGWLDFCLGNALKYVWRCKDKDGSRDLLKAAVYIGWAAEVMERAEEEYQGNATV